MNGQIKPRALVIGGSLGGLFAATALRGSGWDVSVFERSPNDLDSRGGGIVLQPEVVAAINNAGIQRSGALGVLSRDRVYLDREGVVLHATRMPQTQTSWNTLYANLIKGVPEEDYHRGEKLVAFEQVGQHVVARFESGREEEGDLLIGADGGESTVRSILLPDLRPDYAGYVVWRGLVPEAELPKFAADQLVDKFVFQHDSESLMLQYLVPGATGSTNVGERRFNWLWYLKAESGPVLDDLLTDRNGVRRANSVPPGLLAPTQEAYLRAMAEKQANPAFRELVRSTKQIFVQAIMDLGVPKMVFGRVILLGDAAFVPRPHTAGSTAKAAANALALGAALRAAPRDIDAALMAWEDDQLVAGQHMSDWGVRTGDKLMAITA